MAVTWNNPPNIPIPLAKNNKDKLSYAIKAEISKISIVDLEYKIDLSRLDVIALDNNNKIKEFINISE